MIAAGLALDQNFMQAAANVRLIDLRHGNIGRTNLVTERLNFEKKVVIDGNTKRIDVYIPETRVIIEQKSLGKALDQKIRNSGDVDLTPFEQADRYNGKLTFDERARWIVTSNFAEIWIYDMNQKQPEPTKIALDELQSKYPLLDFLVKKEVKTISHEMEVSIKAGDIVGLIYDAFLKQYRIMWSACLNRSISTLGQMDLGKAELFISETRMESFLR